MAVKGLLIDVTRCVGCGACSEACKEGHGLPMDEDVDRLSAKTLTFVEERGDWYVRRMCMHCEEPSCASVCPVGALHKTAEGPVVYEDDRCLGCRYCMIACPFDIPKYQWWTAMPLVRKCTMCHERLVKGEITRCAEACPESATIFGDREELLREAHARMAADPDTYASYVYGEREVGGTNVLFLLPKQVEALGMKNVPADQPMPQLTWEVLSKIPSLVVTLGTALTGIWWITSRREDVRRAEHESAGTHSADSHNAQSGEEQS